MGEGGGEKVVVVVGGEGRGRQGAVQLRHHERHHVMRAEHACFMGASRDGCPRHKNNSKKRLEW